VFEIAENRTNFTNQLLAAAGIQMPNVAGDVQKTDTCADEAEHGITIKSTGNSLLQMMIIMNYFSYNRLAF